MNCYIETEINVLFQILSNSVLGTYNPCNIESRYYTTVFKCLKLNLPKLEHYLERFSHNIETPNSSINC